MILISTLILVFGSALLCFHFQEICRRILRRKFDRDYFMPIVNSNRLEFLSVRQAAQETNAPLEYSRFRMMLKCDCLALLYLLKTVANKEQRFSIEERLLTAYFRLTGLSLSLRHLLRLGERAAMLRMTSILEYYANVLGRRVSEAKVSDLSASEYFLTL